MLLLEVGGYVWCGKHGEVHSDTLNPFGYVEDGKQDYCRPENHSKLYIVGPSASDVISGE